MSDMTSHEVDAYEQNEMFLMNGLEGEPANDGLGKICEHCHKIGLHWKKTDQGFRLFDEKRRLHSCRQYFIHKGLLPPTPELNCVDAESLMRSL